MTREEILNSELRKLEKQKGVIELLRDPEVYDFVKRLVSENAHLGTNSGTTPGTTLPSTNGRRPTPRGRRRSVANISEAIRAAGPKLPKRFTVQHLVDLLEADSFRFRRDEHKGAVRDALFAIVRKPNATFRIIQHGTAGDPNFYEYTGGASED